MAQRPLHLRWMFVKDHWALFLALAVFTVFALVLVAVTMSDPARGLTLGAIPGATGWLGWAMTNRAGYPDREPLSLPHERPHPGLGAGALSPVADPPGASPTPDAPVGAGTGDPAGAGQANPQAAPAKPLRRKRPWDDEAEQPHTPGPDPDGKSSTDRRSASATRDKARGTPAAQPASGSSEPGGT